MVAIAILVALSQSPCAGALAEASARADRYDLRGAAARLRAAADAGCADAATGALYVQGLVDARDAFRVGGAAAALEPVRRSIEALERMAGGRPGPAAIAGLLLQAAAAGAQSERAEMALYLDSAARAERIQRAAGQSGVPVVSSLELAGDLWLQLFDYMRARQAYLAAVEQGPRTMRATAGLARSSARLGIETAACVEYRRMLDVWRDAAPKPSEITEAETYLQRATCRRMAS